jgi:tRNA-Thr(GGU) m(6)t(6)A37 methyltransferase TsaA
VIGVVRTARTFRQDTPVQAAINRAEHGRIEIEPRYEHGLDGLEGFGFAWLLTWLHGADEGEEDPESAKPPPLRQTPFLLQGTGRQIGIFATRGPRRVNPIGLSLIEVVSVQGLTVEFAGVDVIDGTPVIDLKPYVQRFDRPPGEPPCGWFDELTIPEGVTPARLAQPGDEDLSGPPAH